MKNQKTQRHILGAALAITAATAWVVAESDDPQVRFVAYFVLALSITGYLVVAYIGAKQMIERAPR